MGPPAGRPPGPAAIACPWRRPWCRLAPKKTSARRRMTTPAGRFWKPCG